MMLMDLLITGAIVVAALALSVGAGAPVTAGMLRLVSRGEAEPAPQDLTDGTHGQGHSGEHEDTDSAQDNAVDDAEHSSPHETTARELLRGGLWIGLLERLAVSGCILLGYPAGIAVVVAIKGLGRFSTLQGAPVGGVSERFLVGTLTSYLWAALMALAALGVLQAIP